LFQFILRYRIFCVPNAWLFCVVVNLVICVSLGLLYIFVFFSRGFEFVLPANLKGLVARKNSSEMIYFVSSGM